MPPATGTGKWYALNEYEMVGAVRYAGKVYQNEMARAVAGAGLWRPADTAKWRSHWF